jgi:hypothetical protein
MSLALAKIVEGDVKVINDLKKVSPSLFLVKMRKKNQ